MSDPTNRNQADGLAPISTDEEPRFDEESRDPLSDRDRDRLLDIINNPPKPNDAIEKAAKHLRSSGQTS